MNQSQNDNEVVVSEAVAGVEANTNTLDDESLLALTTPSPGAIVPIVSDSARDVILTVNFGVIGPSLALFGMVNNVANVLVFLKIGFKETVNISLFCIAISDFLSLLFLQGTMVCVNPLVVKSGIPYAYLIYYYECVGSFHICFNRVTGVLTAYIAFERCLCVSMPMQVKAILTHKRTICIIISMTATVMCISLQAAFSTYLYWQFDTRFNITRVYLGWMEDYPLRDNIYYIGHTITGIGTFIVVAVCSMILVRIINGKSRWRQETSAPTSSQTPSGKPSKDRQAVVTVTWISVIFIVCSAPAMVTNVMSTVDEDMHTGGAYENLNLTLGSFYGLLHALNSSVNIFIYMKTSAKYRGDFNSIFHCCSRE